MTYPSSPVDGLPTLAEAERDEWEMAHPEPEYDREADLLDRERADELACADYGWRSL